MSQRTFKEEAQNFFILFLACFILVLLHWTSSKLDLCKDAHYSKCTDYGYSNEGTVVIDKKKNLLKIECKE